MNIDPGLGVVIIAVLIFYLRLIIIQRERIKRISRTPVPSGKTKKKAKAPPPAPASRYSILSESRGDRTIGLAGLVLILLGVALNARLIPWLASDPFWWILTAIGIVAFSWAFKL
jgi:hypothetical protein